MLQLNIHMITQQFLTPSQCEHVVQVFHQCVPHVGFSHRQPNRSVRLDTAREWLNREQQVELADSIGILEYHISSHIRAVAAQTFVNYAEIVEWPTGSSQSTHLDYEYHSWTSVVYLNSNYQGGCTQVGEHTSTPSVGKIITFQGSQTRHSVSTVTQGTRYTLAVWYKSFV